MATPPPPAPPAPPAPTAAATPPAQAAVPALVASPAAGPPPAAPAPVAPPAAAPPVPAAAPALAQAAVPVPAPAPTPALVAPPAAGPPPPAPALVAPPAAPPVPPPAAAAPVPAPAQVAPPAAGPPPAAPALVALPVAPPTPPPPPPPPAINLPSGELLENARRVEFNEFCVPLYEASLKGDWVAADIILQHRRYLVRKSINVNRETPLHVAVSGQSNSQSTEFVRHLVNMMEPEDLLLQNINGNTALCLAAGAGNVDTARILVARNVNLLAIPNRERMMPLYIAAVFVKHEMMDYLYERSNYLHGPGWTPENRGWLLLRCIRIDRFDMAQTILNHHHDLLAPHTEEMLRTLAGKPSAFNEPVPHIIWRIIKSITCCNLGPAATESEATQFLRRIWTETVARPRAEIDYILRGPEVLIEERSNTVPVVITRRSTRPSRILFIAAETGNTKFIVELIRKYPDLIWKTNDDGLTIFHVAVAHRHESLYNLLYEIGLMKDFITPMRDSRHNNMLHMVGKTAEASRLQEVSGVAFQMQRELLWFKEVESMIPPNHRENKNRDGRKPYEVFTEKHKDLVSNSEKWMKETASQCIVVSALIATMVFTAAFTIPGGYEQDGDKKDKGFPVFLHNGPLIAFVVFDAISLILSTTSILVFLSILTSRYAQMDFLESLPTKLMVGLATLFLSIATMMTAFGVSFFVLYHRSTFIIVAITISVLAVLPITAYAVLHYHLLMDVFISTRRSRRLFRPKNKMLYYKNPRV